MNVALPPKENKTEQHNFKESSDADSYLRRKGFKRTGYLLEPPYDMFFVERWDKDGLVALKMDIMPFVFSRNLPYEIIVNHYQVDIATVN